MKFKVDDHWDDLDPRPRRMPLPEEHYRATSAWRAPRPARRELSDRHPNHPNHPSDHPPCISSLCTGLGRRHVTQAAGAIRKSIDKKSWGWIWDFLAWKSRPSSPGRPFFAWGFGGLPPPYPRERLFWVSGSIFFLLLLLLFLMLALFLSSFGLIKSGFGAHF